MWEAQSLYLCFNAQLACLRTLGGVCWFDIFTKRCYSLLVSTKMARTPMSRYLTMGWSFIMMVTLPTLGRYLRSVTVMPCRGCGSNVTANHMCVNAYPITRPMM